MNTACVTGGKTNNKINNFMWRHPGLMPRIASAAGRMTRLPMIGSLVKRMLFRPNLTPRNIPILEPALAYSGGIPSIKTVKLAKKVVDPVKVAKEWDDGQAAFWAKLHERQDKMDKAEEAGDLKEFGRLGDEGFKNWMESEEEQWESRVSARPQIPMLPEEKSLLIETKFASHFSEIKKAVEAMNHCRGESENSDPMIRVAQLHDPSPYSEFRVRVEERFSATLHDIINKASSPQEAVRGLIEIFNYLARTELIMPETGFSLSENLINILSEIKEIDLGLYDEVLLALYIDHPVDETFILENLGRSAVFEKVFDQRVAELKSKDPQVKAYAEAWMRVLSIQEEFWAPLKTL